MLDPRVDLLIDLSLDREISEPEDREGSEPIADRLEMKELAQSTVLIQACIEELGRASFS